MKKIGITISLIMGSALAGCNSTAIKNLDAFQKVPMAEAEIMPSPAALNGVKPRVVILKIEDNHSTGRGDQIAELIGTEINATKNVTLVDRALAQNLEQQLLVEGEKTAITDMADIAISGKITSASAINTFTPASTEKDKNGKPYVKPAQCETRGSIEFTLKMTKLPSMEVFATLPASAGALDSKEGYCAKMNQGVAWGILSRAANNAMQKIHNDLKNLFAPTGYVLERRVHESRNLFKISLGKNAGAQQDLKISILKVVAEKNPVSGAIAQEQVKIAEGVISDQIGEYYAYVIVSDPESVNRVRVGNPVRIRYEDSFMDKLNKFAN